VSGEEFAVPLSINPASLDPYQLNYYYMGLALRHIDGGRSRECFLKAAEGEPEPTGALYYNDQPPHMIYYQGLALNALDPGHDREVCRTLFDSV
jgi:hypothetical protein